MGCIRRWKRLFWIPTGQCQLGLGPVGGVRGVRELRGERDSVSGRAGRVADVVWWLGRTLRWRLLRVGTVRLGRRTLRGHLPRVWRVRFAVGLGKGCWWGDGLSVRVVSLRWESNDICAIGHSRCCVELGLNHDWRGVAGTGGVIGNFFDGRCPDASTTDSTDDGIQENYIVVDER